MGECNAPIESGAEAPHFSFTSAYRNQFLTPLKRKNPDG
jgi:hypothetical protein